MYKKKLIKGLNSVKPFEYLRLKPQPQGYNLKTISLSYPILRLQPQGMNLISLLKHWAWQGGVNSYLCSTYLDSRVLETFPQCFLPIHIRPALLGLGQVGSPKSPPQCYPYSFMGLSFVSLFLFGCLRCTVNCDGWLHGFDWDF